MEEVAIHPLVLSVAVNTYVVVVVGVAIGLEILAGLKPVEGVQLYVTPATGVIPICAPPVFDVQDLNKFGPAEETGTSTSTVTRI